MLSGKWKEEESQQLLQAKINEMHEKLPHINDQRIFFRHLDETMQLMKTLEAQDKLYEKEYYFDEGLGESLMEHIEKIKNDFPNVEVQTRRDRDGFAIVKTLHKPQYKYNLNRILNFNPDEAERLLKET